MQSILKHHPHTLCSDFTEAAAPYLANRNLYKHTNCYSYALGLTEHGKGYPGQIAHDPLKSPRGLRKEDMSVQTLRALLTQGDGLRYVVEKDLLAYKEQALIAAFVQAGQDCHFFRRHKDGLWSHQGGHGGKITNEDDYGFIIQDPRRAVIRGYDEFVGYFALPMQGLSYYTDPYKHEVF